MQFHVVTTSQEPPTMATPSTWMFLGPYTIGQVSGYLFLVEIEVANYGVFIDELEASEAVEMYDADMDAGFYMYEVKKG